MGLRGLAEKIREDYQVIFRQEWPVWLGGLFTGLLNVFLFLFFQPWTTLDGVLNWGDSILNPLGVVRSQALSPLLRSGSVVNLGVLFGALASALLAGQFAIRVGPRRELLKGFVGGVLMGTGAALARGCNIGGFFSATSAFAANGLTMAAGLVLGAFVGARFVLWEAMRGGVRMAPTVAGAGASSSRMARLRLLQPYFGLAVLLGLVAWMATYMGLGYADRAILLLLGLLLGVVSQRSRLCFVQAFREPFLTGDTRHTRAMLLALLISIMGFALIKVVQFERAEDFVRATFWLGSFVGGSIFGFGMVLAGGCGAGTLWRAGEGHVKLWFTLIAYIFSASLVRDWLLRTGLQAQLGEAVFLPNLMGWAWAIVFLLAIILLWYLFTRWNEASRRLTAL